MMRLMEKKSNMKIIQQDLAQVALEANYHVKEYQERVGIKGVLTWWTTIKTDRLLKNKTLTVNCDDHYDKVIINGKSYKT